MYQYFRNGSRTDVNEDIDAEIDKDGLYKVTARHHFDNLTLPDLTIFVCNLSIPGTNYVLSKTLELEYGKYLITYYILIMYVKATTQKHDLMYEHLKPLLRAFPHTNCTSL